MVNFTFVPQHNPDGRSQGRRGRKACGSCRFRKRRCYHSRRSESPEEHPGHLPGDIGNVDDAARDGELSQALDSPAKRRRTDAPVAFDYSPARRQSHRRRHLISPPFDAEQEQEQDDSSPDGTPPPRFIGDLNPEARLLGGSPSPDKQQVVSPDGVGVWVQPRSNAQRSPQGASTTSPANRQRGHDRGRGHVASQHRPHDSDLIDGGAIAALTDLYFANVHPILPLVNKTEFRQSLSQHRAPMALIHVLCLIAAKDTAAGPHLRLLESGESAVSVRSFCARLHKSVTSSMASGGSKFHKITQIRILGLLSLHHEGSDGPEQASSHICQAMHHSQTLALHLPQPNDHDCEMRRIFWCLWTLDRLNAVTNSRPCIMNDVDIAVEPLTLAQSGSAAFDVWFLIAKTLNSVIALYRPTNPEAVTGLESMTGFDEYVDEANGWHLPRATLGTLRIFHLATAMLSHRLKTIKTLPTNTAARLRQQLAASQVIRHMKEESRLPELHPLPVTVYAASLALSVSYQQMRYARFIIDQEEAYRDFIAACDILKMLRQKWSAADAMASLSRRIAIELENTPSLALLRIERHETSREGPDNTEWAGDAADASGQQREGACAGESQVFDIFGGMDDISWMYLDVEGPISFDSLAWTGLDMAITE